jgi:threonine dehydrogenase-like Zn-dependent dehydrogenase
MRRRPSGPGEALVRIESSGLCGTDLLLQDGVYRGRRRPVPSPLIVGHEASGEVIELGPGTSWPAPGTRVGIEAVTGCGRCHVCLRGHYNLCQDWHHLGLTCAGVLAELAVIPAASLLPLPESRDDGGRGLSRAAGDGRAHARARQTGAIHERGHRRARAAGFPAFPVLRAAGLDRIVMYGQTGDESRLALAASLGAHAFLGDRQSIAAHAADTTGGLGFGLSIEAGGTSGAIQSALEIVGGQGTLVSLGIVKPTEIDVLQVMRKNLTWFGVVASVRRHFAEAIQPDRTRPGAPVRTDHAPAADRRRACGLRRASRAASGEGDVR